MSPTPTLSPATSSPSSAQPAAASVASQFSARNPISLRLYKVLAARYDDPAIRDALETLSELYECADDGVVGTLADPNAGHDGDASSQPPSEIAHTRAPGRPGSPAASQGIAARARKSLRRDAELMLARGSRQFLRAFQQVDSHLDILQQHIDVMQARCTEAQLRLQSTNQACKYLLEKTGGLRSARDAIVERKAAADIFLMHFLLTDEEACILQSRDVQVDNHFFQAMSRAEQIIADSRVLVTGEDGSTKAGIDIIAKASEQLEQAYDKLARWCSFEFRHFVRDALLEATPVLAESIRWLRKRPELFSEALSVLVSTRRSALVSAFTDALTRGGPGGLPRPIEIFAHDPLRYVGDMLAWVHQSIAAEHEFLGTLFSMKDEKRMVGSIRQFKNGEEEEWIRELMDRVFENLKLPLRTRIRQTIRSQESCIVSCKVANLLSFYSLTLRRTIGDNAALSETLDEITNEAHKMFLDTIEAQARNLARTLLPDDQDEQPPIALLDHTQVLREIIHVYKTSLMENETEEQLTEDFRPILDLMVDAAVNMCLTVSDARRTQKPTWDSEVFMLNCLTHLLNVLRPNPFTGYKVHELQFDVDARAELLTQSHLSDIMRDTSLAECISVCKSASSDPPISRIGAMQPQPLSQTLRKFADWLSSDAVVHPARLAPLLDRRLAERIHKTALCALVDAYACIGATVLAPENKYEAANVALGAQQPYGSLLALRQILGIENEDEDVIT